MTVWNSNEMESHRNDLNHLEGEVEAAYENGEIKVAFEMLVSMLDTQRDMMRIIATAIPTHEDRE